MPTTLTTLYENRPSPRIGVAEVQNSRCFAILFGPARPSAGIGVVEVQKLEVFCNFDPVRASAWSRCKNSSFFAILFWLARPSAGIGVVKVQKLEVFGAFVVRAGPRELSRGSCACSRDRRVAGSIRPWSAGGLRKLHGATCIKQLARSNLRRASCTDQFAQSDLPRATCAEQLTQSNLHRAAWAEQLAQSSLGRAACTEQLAGSKLRGAICTEQLAGSHLQGATPSGLTRAFPSLNEPTGHEPPGAVSRSLHECFV